MDEETKTIEGEGAVEAKPRKRGPKPKQVVVEKGVVVEFGTPEHRAWLGVDREPDPVKRAALEEAWEAGEPEIHAANKMPIGKHFNAPDTDIVEGFKRRGDGTGR